MSETLNETLRKLEKAAQAVLDQVLAEIDKEDDSDIYTIKDEGESK
jgi:hypothetical protein